MMMGQYWLGKTKHKQLLDQPKMLSKIAMEFLK